MKPLENNFGTSAGYTDHEMLKSIRQGEFNTGIIVLLKNEHRVEVDNKKFTEDVDQFLPSPQIYLRESARCGDTTQSKSLIDVKGEKECIE